MNDSWFQAKKFYEKGAYPGGVSSAMRTFPGLRECMVAEVRKQSVRRILEIGPGDQSVCVGMSGAVFLDASHAFLSLLSGHRVVGDAQQLPFRYQAFDLVFMSDVLTHIKPVDRRDVIIEMLRVGKDAMVLNPKMSGNEEFFPGSTVTMEEVVQIFASIGRKTTIEMYVVTLNSTKERHELALIQT